MSDRWTLDKSGEWWDSILARDGRYRDDAGSLLSCVFCGTRRSASQSMLAWWDSGQDWGGIMAAGLYCHGLHNNGRCVDAAKRVHWLLLDTHASPLTRWPDFVRTYPLWSGQSLRRLVLVVDALKAGQP